MKGGEGPRASAAPSARVARIGRVGAVALLCAAGTVMAQPQPQPDEPLGVGTSGTLRLLFLDMPAADARDPGDQVALDLRWRMANDWSTPTTLERGGRTAKVQVDEQSEVLALSIRLPWSRLFGSRDHTSDHRPFASRVSTTADLQLVQHWGGWTDGIIEWWHRVLGVDGFSRSAFPRHAVDIALLEPGGATVLGLTSSRLGVGDLAVRTQVLLAESGDSRRDPGRRRRALSLRGDLKVPLGSLRSASGSGGWDAGVGLAGTAELSRWLTGHALVTTSRWSGLPSSLPLQPRAWHSSAEIAFAARAGSFTLLFEDRLVSPLMESGWIFVNDGPLTSSATYAVLRAHNQVSWGLRRGRLTLWMSEDWTPGSNPTGRVSWYYDSNHPDFAMGLTFATRF